MNKHPAPINPDSVVEIPLSWHPPMSGGVDSKAEQGGQNSPPLEGCPEGAGWLKKEK
jgi:hypothetical protein